MEILFLSIIRASFSQNPTFTAFFMKRLKMHANVDKAREFLCSLGLYLLKIHGLFRPRLNLGYALNLCDNLYIWFR